MENKKTILLLVIIIVMAFILLIIKINTKTEPTISYNNKVNLIKNTITQEEPKTVYIKEHRMKNNTIYGIVKNNTNSTVKNLEISADCYDKDNNKLINTKNFLNELKPGETWSFSMWTNSNAVKYKNLKVIYK